METGEALDRSMAEAGLKDADVASALRVSSQTVGAWRSKRKNPRSEHFIALIRLVPGFFRLLNMDIAA